METNKLYEYNKQKLINRYQYLGILGTYQTISVNLYQPIVYNNLNQRQHFLFKRVLHGLNVYTPEEIKSMHSLKRKRIKKVWRRAQKVINGWKQIICNKRATEIFQEYFSNSVLGKAIIDTSDTYVDDKFINRMTLKELDIRYEDLVIKFIQEGLLPRNFLSLKYVKS